MKITKMGLVIVVTLYLIAANISEAADGKTVIEQNRCVSCHDMSGNVARTISDLLNKKAPDLFYAGSKFQEKFLFEFLQRPYPIRPTGTVYLNYVSAGEGIDKIQDPPLCASKLSREEAQVVSHYLMTLTDLNMPTGLYKRGTEFARANAKMIFFKSGACNACHQVDVGGGSIKGGMSGPILYDAGSRLNGDWVFNYLKDPQHWTPKTWMPKRELPDNTWFLLTNYIMTMEKPKEMKMTKN
ncbi:MAG: c-type cytochrome [Nitrospinae bacterium]|nr:c-type cytochrome [Nitrospinota bacterium]